MGIFQPSNVRCMLELWPKVQRTRALCSRCVAHNNAALKEKFGAMISVFARIDFMIVTRDRAWVWDWFVICCVVSVCHRAKQNLMELEVSRQLTLPCSLCFGDLSDEIRTAKTHFKSQNWRDKTVNRLPLDTIVKIACLSYFTRGYNRFIQRCKMPLKAVLNSVLKYP